MSRIHMSATLAVALLLSACGSEPTDPTEPLVIMETILVADDGDIVYSHTDHWHGAPVVRTGTTTGFTVNFTGVRASPGDHDIPPTDQWFTLAAHPGHELRVVIQDTTLARWTGGPVQGTLQGLRAGASLISFVVRRGSTTIYEAPPLNFVVQPGS